jgi:membrane-associated phospholipid phosphatase
MPLRRTLRHAFDDPKMRLAVGLAGVAVTALPASDNQRVSGREASIFRAVNDLPEWLHPPTWTVMQLGTVGAGPAAAAIAHRAGDDKLAARLLIAGPMTWALAKVIKRGVRRGRPRALLGSVRTRGQEATGLGYLSGHAGVAMAVGLAAAGSLGSRGRKLLLVVVPAVGVARMYVGAHLPLDVAGGASLGLAVDAAVELGTTRAMRAYSGRRSAPIT